MDFIFLLQLMGLTGIAYTLFYAYGQVSSRLSAGQLSGLSGGFVAFLAVSELIALPFILLHLSFLHFYILFLAVNIPLFIYGAWLLMRKLPNFKFRIIKPSLLGLTALASILACTLITQFYVKYDADDSYYVSLIQQNIGNDHLYTTDPSTGNPDLPISQTYSFEGWELIESALAHSFRLSPVEFAHSLVPLIVIPLVFLAHRRIFKSILAKTSQVNYATIVLGLFFLFSGFSLYSQGTFLLTRVWQGKAILAALIIPLLIFTLFKLYYARLHRKQLYLSIFILNVAAICLNPAALFLNLAAISAFGLMILYKTREMRDFGYLALASLPILLAGIGTIILTKLNPSTVTESSAVNTVTTTYLQYLDRFIGDSWYFYIYLLSIIGLLIIKRSRKAILLFAIFPAVLLLTILNPFLFEPIKSYVTSNTYWRLFWLIPITIALPFISVKVAGWLQRRLYKPAAYLAVAVVIVLSGSYMFDTSRAYVARDTSRTKVPPGVEQVADYMTALPEGKVLAASDPAAYLHNFTTKHTLLVSRPLYLAVYYPADSAEYSELSKMQKAIDGDTTGLSPSEFDRLIKKYEVKYLVFSPQDKQQQPTVQPANAELIFSTAHYNISQIY